MTAPVVYQIGPRAGEPVDWSKVPEHMIGGDIVGGHGLGSLWEREIERTPYLTQRLASARARAARRRAESVERHSISPRHSTGGAPRVSGPNREPRHVKPHEHIFVTVASFDGLRASIGECACGDTRTIWRVSPIGAAAPLGS